MISFDSTVKILLNGLRLFRSLLGKMTDRCTERYTNRQRWVQAFYLLLCRRFGFKVQKKRFKVKNEEMEVRGLRKEGEREETEVTEARREKKKESKK